MPSVSAPDVKQLALRCQLGPRKVEQDVGRSWRETLAEKRAELLVVLPVHELHAGYLLSSIHLTRSWLIRPAEPRLSPTQKEELGEPSPPPQTDRNGSTP